MRKHETPLLFKKKPFGCISYDQLQLEDKGSLIDEKLCHLLDLPIRNIEYRHFTLAPGIVTRSVGQIKISVQRLFHGKSGDTVQFSGKVIRNLENIIGSDSVAGAFLSKKLADIPVNHSKPKDKHFEPSAKPPSTSIHIGVNPQSATNCCIHQNCQQCRDGFDEMNDSDPLNSDSSSDTESDDCDDSISIGSWTAIDPLCTDSSSSESSALPHVQRVRASNKNWMQQFRPTKRESEELDKKVDHHNSQGDHDFFEKHFPGGGLAARNLLERMAQRKKREESSDEEEKETKSKKEEEKAERKKKRENEKKENTLTSEAVVKVEIQRANRETSEAIRVESLRVASKTPKHCSVTSCYCESKFFKKLCRTRFL